MRRSAALLAAIGLIGSMAGTSLATDAVGNINRFYGNFDLLEYYGTTVVAHVEVTVVDPTEDQLVPGHLDIYWAGDNPVRESHGQIVDAFFFPLFDDPDEGAQLGVYIQGSLCDYQAPKVGRCQPFLMVFVDTLDPAFPNHAKLNVACPGGDFCAEDIWYDVGAGQFVMKWVRET